MQSGKHLENPMEDTILWNYLFSCGRPISMDFMVNPNKFMPL